VKSTWSAVAGCATTARALPDRHAGHAAGVEPADSNKTLGAFGRRGPRARRRDGARRPRRTKLLGQFVEDPRGAPGGGGAYPKFSEGRPACLPRQTRTALARRAARYGFVGDDDGHRLAQLAHHHFSALAEW